MKMNSELALNVLKAVRENDFTCSGCTVHEIIQSGNGDCNVACHDAFEVALQALDTQIPKMAVKRILAVPVFDSNGEFSGWGEERPSACCPRCGSLVGYLQDGFERYCSRCGQAFF